VLAPPTPPNLPPSPDVTDSAVTCPPIYSNIHIPYPPSASYAAGFVFPERTYTAAAPGDVPCADDLPSL